MNLDQRMELHESQVRDLYRTRPPLLRAHRGKDDMLKKVEELISLQEEQLALAHDFDRAEHKIKFCDIETPRGKAQHDEYLRMSEHARSRIEEIVPRIEELKREVGVDDILPKDEAPTQGEEPRD